MLSLFPQILFLSPLAATFLRVAAALVFFSVAYAHYRKRQEFAFLDFPFVGRGAWIPIFAAGAELAIALALSAGIYTQLAALFGAIGALKFLVLKKRYPAFVPISKTASALLFVICISVVFTGAGAFAFDLPL